MVVFTIPDPEEIPVSGGVQRTSCIEWVVPKFYSEVIDKVNFTSPEFLMNGAVWRLVYCSASESDLSLTLLLCRNIRVEDFTFIIGMKNKEAYIHIQCPARYSTREGATVNMCRRDFISRNVFLQHEDKMTFYCQFLYNFEVASLSRINYE